MATLHELRRAFRYPICSSGRVVVVRIVRLLRSFTDSFPAVIGAGTKQQSEAGSLFIFLSEAKPYLLSTLHPQLSEQLSICYDGEVWTVIDSKRYSQEVLPKLENFCRYKTNYTSTPAIIFRRKAEISRSRYLHPVKFRYLNLTLISTKCLIEDMPKF